MWTIIIAFLAEIGLPLLGMFFKAITNRVKEAGLNADALQYLSDLVTSAEGNATLDSTAKYQWVFDSFKDYLGKNGITVAESLLNALIELAVHQLHHGA